MLKAEKALRECVRQTNLIDDKHGDAINRMNSKLISVLVKAVREDCAKVAEGFRYEYDNTEVRGADACRTIAAAIRGNK